MAKKKLQSPAPRFVPKELEAKTDNQQRYLDALMKHPMVFGVGPAGTGKTFLASAFSIDELAQGKIDQIVITRATVPVSGENLGYLPGGLNDKMEPWTAEIFDIFRERVGDLILRQLIGEQRIKIVPFAFMRGRTFKNARVIVDEMQNATPAQAKMLVTRIGQGSQMLINGDLKQSDLRGRNGLQELLEMIDEQNLMLPVVHFTTDDVRRSHLCQLWVNAYERKEAA